ncbi:hypothetical protein [Arthrobacter sp. UYEF36]|uniref:hypothetical protein n=1 Tax=Arthrobacter sp. UYEF36 TaxID=1756366 RepID=UPI00339AA3C9
MAEWLILDEGGRARHLAFGRIDVLDNNVGIAKVGGVMALARGRRNFVGDLRPAAGATRGQIRPMPGGIMGRI